MSVNTPVVICGAGPVGLTMSILLSRFGIQSVVVEKRASISTLPRSRGIMARTVEIWRQFGLTETMESFALPPNWCNSFAYLDTLAGELIGEMPSNCMAAGANAAWTPSDFKCAAQDRIDAMLLEHALTYPEATVRFSTELMRFDQDADGVTITLRCVGSDHIEEIRTPWLIAADGGRSPLRAMAGIQMTGRDLRTMVNTHFTADLSQWTGGREAALLWTLAKGRLGCFQPLDGKKRWMCQIQLESESELTQNWTRERATDRIREMIGGSSSQDVDIEMHSAYTYTVAARVADRLRDGRLLLVGDAAHQIPPFGGFGMNTGVQTAHNLAWKLAAVMGKIASPTLLDSFDTERREVAIRACEFGTKNVGYVADMVRAETIDEQRKAIAASIEYGNWTGLDLGVHYERPGAFVPDSTLPPFAANPIVDYEPCAKPGYRAPHLWVQRGQERISTVDLFERQFVLLTGLNGRHWIEAAIRLSREDGIPLNAFRVGEGGDLEAETEKFLCLYGIDADGAVLVRPDGHVAFRSPSLPREVRETLRSALEQTLA